MTQKSSLINLLADLWKRCFAKKYATKAGGKSPNTHNWRKCPKCKKRVQELLFNSSPERCKHCDTPLGFETDVKFCSCGTTAQMTCTDPYCEKCKKELPPSVMEFKDSKGRRFTLLKPLYNPIIILWRGLTAISIIFLICFYRVVEVPVGFTNEAVDAIVWALIMFSLLGVLMDSMSLKYGKHTLIGMLCIIGCSTSVALIVAMPVYNEFTVIPIWREKPTEESVKLKLEANLKKMQPGIKQFEAAMQIRDFNARPYFVEAAKVDFEGLIRKHGSYSSQLDPWYGAQFFPLLNKYLESLDQDELIRQCCDDPWNVIFTPLSVQRFGTVITACDNIMP